MRKIYRFRTVSDINDPEVELLGYNGWTITGMTRGMKLIFSKECNISESICSIIDYTQDVCIMYKEGVGEERMKDLLRNLKYIIYNGIRSCLNNTESSFIYDEFAKLYNMISDKITVTGDMTIDEIMDIINNSEAVKYFKLDKYK